jgi:hypothetical protein
MSTAALIMIVVTELVITAFTGYFFYRVLNSPKKVEPDSYSENN